MPVPRNTTFCNAVLAIHLTKMNKLRTQLFLLRAWRFMYFLNKKATIVSFPAKDPRITYHILNQNPTGNNSTLAKNT